MRSRPGDRPDPHAVDEHGITDGTLASPLSSASGAAAPDRGFSLVEVLISIALMGLVIASTVSLLQVTIMASGSDRDHSNAHAWLQTAADVLYARPLEPCAPADATATNMADIVAKYESTIQQTENPESWPDVNIEIYDLQFWHIDMDPVTKFTEEGWGDLCDAADTNLQRVGIEVRSSSGKIVERVEVIIGE